MNVITPFALLEPTPVSLRSNDGLGWDSFAATLLGTRAGAYRVPAMAQYRVNVHVGLSVWVNCACDGCRCSCIQAYGDTDMTPAGVSDMWAGDASCRTLRIVISDRSVRSIAEQTGTRADITPHL